MSKICIRYMLAAVDKNLKLSPACAFRLIPHYFSWSSALLSLQSSMKIFCIFAKKPLLLLSWYLHHLSVVLHSIFSYLAQFLCTSHLFLSIGNL